MFVISPIDNNIIKSDTGKTAVHRNFKKAVPNNKTLYELPGPDYGTLPDSVVESIVANDRTKLLHSLQPEEYDELIDKIFKYTISYREYTYCLLTLNGYPGIEQEFKGLIPYCGVDDVSDIINCWLSGRKYDYSDTLSENKVANIVNALDYSLARLDEKYGKYEGKVYRTGYFNPNVSKQFYSTSRSIDCTFKHGRKRQPSPKDPYSIIKVKSGHNIEKFQRDMNTTVANHFADIEEEILIDRNSKFRKVPPEEYTKEDIDDILEVLLKTTNINITPDEIPELNRRIDVLKYISIWEEI